MTDLHAIFTVAVIALVTAFLRFLPFWLFRDNRNMPPALRRLGQALPCAIMGMLVVYCLKDISVSSAAAFLPHCIGCATVVLLHVWKRNTLLSIGTGTLIYMILVQTVF